MNWRLAFVAGGVCALGLYHLLDWLINRLERWALNRNHESDGN